MEATQWGGAIDNVGGEILTWLTRTVDLWGNIASIGLAGSHKLETTVMPFILRGINLLGINSSATPRDVRLVIWKRLATDLRPRHFDKFVTRTIGFDELPGAFDEYLKGGVRGRTVVSAAAIESRLTKGAEALGIALETAQVKALLALMTELGDWNTRVNLTAIREPPEIVDKHLLDSLAVLPHLRGFLIADIGSGAGFPGLPLAIANPGRRYTLVESTGKKAGFLRHVVATLALPNVEIILGRSEALKPRTPFDGVIARALGPLAEFIRMAGHLPGRDGRLLAMKGHRPDGELNALPAGWKVQAVHEIRVPGLDAERCLVELARV
jgi:16S rRNA (guanine527-N7)-methyltransferase